MTVAAVLRQKGNSVISVGPGTSVPELVSIIASRRIGAVIVLDTNDKMIGIVSERDVVKALAAHGAEVLKLHATDLMTRNVVTGTLRTTIDQAMEIMDAGYFRHLPVLDSDGTLLGIISVRDLVKYRMMQHEQDVHSLKAYITRTE